MNGSLLSCDIIILVFEVVKESDYTYTYIIKIIFILKDFSHSLLFL